MKEKLLWWSRDRAEQESWGGRVKWWLRTWDATQWKSACQPRATCWVWLPRPSSLYQKKMVAEKAPPMMGSLQIYLAEQLFTHQTTFTRAKEIGWESIVPTFSVTKWRHTEKSRKERVACFPSLASKQLNIGKKHILLGEREGIMPKP